MTAEHGLVARRVERPIGMGAVEVAVGVDHLGLDPDAELHAEPPHVLDERRQTVGIDLGRHPPVAEPRRVVAPGTEPSVVEHEAFDAERRRRRRRAAASRPVSWSKYTASHVLSRTGRGRSTPGWLRSRAARGGGTPRRRASGRRRRRRRRPTASRTLARLEAELAGMEELAELQVATAVRQALRQRARGCRSMRGARPRPRRATRRSRASPPNTSGGCSCDVRPRRFSAMRAPCVHGDAARAVHGSSGPCSRSARRRAPAPAA